MLAHVLPALCVMAIGTACCLATYLVGHRDGRRKGAQEQAQRELQAICRVCGPAAAVAVAFALEEAEACERPAVN